MTGPRVVAAAGPRHYYLRRGGSGTQHEWRRVGDLASTRGAPGIRPPAADALAWAVAFVLATLPRYDFRPPEADQREMATTVAIAIAVQIGVGFASGFYTGRWRFGSLDEVFALVRVIGITTSLVFLINPVLRGAQFLISPVLGAQLLPRPRPAIEARNVV